MTVTVLAPYLKQRFVDANGAALYLGTVSTFAAGTSTPIVTYKDAAGVATNTNPITLNPRGECDLWLVPNTAYKIQVNDAQGNLIFVEDNVVNSQLLTLYAGVDTGAANTYLLNFTAQFTAYVDGIVLYWIPSHTNTGASTVNVNGLGVLNIINQDGSGLSAGELLANNIAVMMFKGTGFQLISSGLASNASQTLFAARRSLSAGNQTLTNNATTTAVFDTADINQGTNYSTSTGLFTAPIPGIYTFSAQLLLTSNASANQIPGLYYFSKNNNFIVPNIIALSGLFTQQAAVGVPATSQGFLNGTAVFQLAAGDTVGIRCQQPNNTGGAFTLTFLAGYNNFTGYKCG